MREERGRGCSFSYFPSLFLISLPNSFVAVFVMPFCFALFIMSAAAVTSFSESSSTRGKSMSLVMASCPWRLPRCLAVFLQCIETHTLFNIYYNVYLPGIAVYLRLRRFLPNKAPSTMPPTLRSSPPRVVGMPVVRATFCLKAVTPSARFHENDNPGIFIRFSFICIYGS